MGETYDKNLWCADATDGDDLPDRVGTIEICGESSYGVNIQPGYEDGEGAEYDAERDGEIVVVPSPSDGEDAGVACAVFWNWAMKPGWQKWRSKYRYGTISNIDFDADTCDVELDEFKAIDTPDETSLDLNQTTSLTEVDIEYMSCNSAAFEDGDLVIVELSHDANNNWINPKVIGVMRE